MGAQPPRASSSPRLRGDLRGLAWMAGAQVLFALMTLAARMGSRSTGWATVGAGRALGGVLVALGVALHTGSKLRPRRPGLAWARSLLGTASMLATFFALGSRSLSVSDAVTLFATSPLFIALLAPRILGERSEPGLWGLLLVAFGGVALISGPHFASAPLPALVALFAALAAALAMMFLRKLRQPTPGEAAESSESIALHFAAVAFLAHTLCVFRDPRPPEPRDAAWIGVAGVSGGLAQLAMTRAYALAEAPRLGALSYLSTVLSFLAAALLLGETPRWWQILGACLVVGAGVALAVGERGKTKERGLASGASEP